MHHHQPCGSNPRLIKIEPWLTLITEPPSLYTSPTAHVSTPHLFSLYLGASVFLLYPISIHTSILTKLIAPLLYPHNLLSIFLQISIFFISLSVFFGISLLKNARIDPIFADSRFNQIVEEFFSV